MPAHQIEIQDPKSVARLLLAIVLANKGELRIKACDYDSIDQGHLLVVDFDRATSEVVLTATSNFGRALVVQPESHAWVKPAETATLERARVTAERETQQRTVRTDEELADMEDAAARRQAVAKAVAEGKIPLQLRTVAPASRGES